MDLLGTWGKRTQDLLGGVRRSLLGDDLPPAEKRAATVGTFGPSVLEQTGTMLAAQEKALKRGGIRDMLHDPEAYQAAKQVAGNLDFTGTFGGRLAKTADLGALAKAEELAKAGTNPADIWKETGWFKGVDDKWRHEIDDSKTRVTPPKGKTLPEDTYAMGDLLAHHDLYKAYPSLKGIPTNIDTSRSHSSSFEGGGITIGQVPLNRDPFKSTALHELQHQLQDREGFARGADVNELTQRANVPREKETLRDLMIAEALQKAATSSGVDALSHAADLQRGGSKFSEGTWEALYQAPDRLALDIERQRQRLRLAEKLGVDPSGSYARNAGEVEARAVQARRDLLPEQRRARPPWLDYDVPPEQQIVRGVR
jgi:hypothetical protein